MITKTARKAISTLRRLRNGTYPEFGPVTHIQEEANRICAYRTKSWTFAGVGSATAGGPTFIRWRTFIHTSSHCRYCWVRVVCKATGSTDDPVVTVRFAVPGVSPHAFATFSYDPATTGFAVDQDRTSDGASVLVELDPDTDYEVSVQETGDAITLACCIWEAEQLFDTPTGYVASGVVAGQEILDTHRSGATGLLRDAWLQNGAPLITWSADGDGDAFTLASISEPNIIDGTTSVSAASAGFTIDLRYRSTVRRSGDGVPVIMRAYLECSAGTASLNLKNSSGTTLATCSSSSSTAAWVSSGVFYLPATLAKYDLTGTRTGGLGTTTIYAVSLYSASDL